MIVNLILVATCVLYLGTAADPLLVDKQGNPVVSTRLGFIKGKKLETRLGETFMGFRGIRYAEAPVGELRFQPPQAIKQWRGTFDATEDGPMCPQPTENRTDVSEDCLRINVYTKKLPGSGDSPKKPVILYLHPGGFYVLSGQSKNFAGPKTFMDRDIVFVTINYRLGTLGFMSTGTKESPGNNGMKDQVMALKWIRDHIENFGGDPNSVTILGYSAGAWSATLHMVSPMSKGLFHKVIVMSAASTSQYVVPEHQIELAQRQARLMNCTDADVKTMIDCLKGKDAVEMGFTLSNMFEYASNPVLMWSPVIEPDFGQERFLTEDPTVLFRSGRFEKVPIITGITEEEFAMNAVAVLKNETLRVEMDVNFTTIAPICFLYERGTERSLEISKALRNYYVKDPILNEQSLDGLAHLFSDSLIGFAVHRFMRLASPYTTVHYYKNTYVGKLSHLYYPDKQPYHGPVHHDDLMYLLDGAGIKRNDPDNKTVERMTKLWAAFAATGDPNQTEGQVLPQPWLPVRGDTHNYLEIGNELKMKVGIFEDRFAIWDNLFPIQYPTKTV